MNWQIKDIVWKHNVAAKLSEKDPLALYQDMYYCWGKNYIQKVFQVELSILWQNVPRHLCVSTDCTAAHSRALRRSVLEQTAKPSHAVGLVLRKYFGQ